MASHITVRSILKKHNPVKKIEPIKLPLWCSSFQHSQVLVAELCLTLCNPMDCRPPGSSLHGILQVRIPEWVAIPFSRGSFPIQGLNPGLLHCKQILYHPSHQGNPEQALLQTSPEFYGNYFHTALYGFITQVYIPRHAELEILDKLLGPFESTCLPFIPFFSLHAPIEEPGLFDLQSCSQCGCCWVHPHGASVPLASGFSENWQLNTVLDPKTAELRLDPFGKIVGSL